MTLRYSHPGASERRKAVAPLSDGHHVDTVSDLSQQRDSQVSVHSDGHHMDTTNRFVVSYSSAKPLKTKYVHP
jgi:hypothetical protein